MATSESRLPDINQLLQQLNLPGVDINALVNSRRKDIEALAAANQKAYEGLQALVQRQTQILQESMQKWQANAQGANLPQSLSEGATRQAEMARQAFEQALNNMRELAELAAKSQAQAFEVVQKRVQESLEETRQQFQPKKS